MKVLIVDDNNISVKGIVDYCAENEWECIVSDFEFAYEHLISFNPDAIVLDWRGEADEIEKGLPVLDLIWNLTFRPVVIYSAYSTIIEADEKYKETGLLTLIQKGNDKPVCDFLSENEKLSSSLAEFRANMGFALLQSLRSVDYLKKDNDIDPSTASYVLARRVSAYLDEKYVTGIAPSWAQYICPPVNLDLLACDVIRKVVSEEERNHSGNPCDYRIVLTPSCDLATGEGRIPTRNVLCAKCTSKEIFYQNSVQGVDEDKKPDIVMHFLNQGYNGKFVALPGLLDIIPYMTVNLKKTELIDRNTIATDVSGITESSRYYRVASIASPFREQIVWAHMLNSCRPGVPDRNMELWAKDILTV